MHADGHGYSSLGGERREASSGSYRGLSPARADVRSAGSRRLPNRCPCARPTSEPTATPPGKAARVQDCSARPRTAPLPWVPERHQPGPRPQIVRDFDAIREPAIRLERQREAAIHETQGGPESRPRAGPPCFGTVGVHGPERAGAVPDIDAHRVPRTAWPPTRPRPPAATSPCRLERSPRAHLRFFRGDGSCERAVG